MSVDLITAPARDEEKQRLDARFTELEQERRKFTEAAVRLGKEKAALEVRAAIPSCVPTMRVSNGLASRPSD